MRPPSVFVASSRRRRVSGCGACRSERSSTRQRGVDPAGLGDRHTVPQIDALWQTDESHGRKLIHEFNERGFGSLRPDNRGGRPRRITADRRERIVAGTGARSRHPGEALHALVAAQAGGLSARARDLRDLARPPWAGAQGGRPLVPAPAPGRPVRIPTTRPRRPGCCRSTSGPPRAAQ
jgi:hypothetical protein